MKHVYLLTFTILTSFLILSCQTNKSPYYVENGLSMVARVEGDEFQIYKNGGFEETFLTGVNMGAALPGAFPGELAIPKEMYMAWFQMIHDLNADVIRVYTTLMPEFYEALYEFNQTVDRPLYIMHGVWVNEVDIREISDAYGENNKILYDFINDGVDLVDVIHGNAELPIRPGFAHGSYTADISQYVIGWILGIEWDPELVFNTNINNPDKESYQGDYLETTDETRAFEVFLAEVGDNIIAYEVDNYQMMRPVSFVNWPTTDHLRHPNEPDEKEDLVSVNMNHIHANENFHAGYFASFHIYPYYPEFLNYSLSYSEYIDQDGQINAYQGYLSDLKSNLNMPVFVAEFGVPASRGKTHEDINHGYNQGYMSESQQGEIAVQLLNDIYASEYSGGFLFTWQDEWFKRTWNTMDLDLPSRRPYWNNIQTNEQHFGLLAFEPGEKTSIRYVDGNVSDWEEDSPDLQTDALEIYTAFDEKYIYMRIDAIGHNLNEERLIIPIMTHPNQGNDFIVNDHIRFSKPIDFYIDIRGESYAEIFVDAYYDPFYFLYHYQLEMLDTIPLYHQKNTGHFNNIYQALSAELYLPEEDKIVPFMKHNTGKLTYGIGNPNMDAYNSLADYYIKDNIIEIRIPWLLLNISDPSTKQRLGDFYENDWFVSESMPSIWFGGDFIQEDGEVTIDLYETTWQSWHTPTYHMRLKKSYALVQAGFLNYLEE